MKKETGSHMAGKQAELSKQSSSVAKAAVADCNTPTQADSYNSYHKEKNSKGKVKGAC